MAKRIAGLSDKGVEALERKPNRYVVSDPELRGHYVRVPPDGPKVFAAVARTPCGKQVWAKIGTTSDLKIEQARERARQAIRRIKDGRPAFEPKPQSVAEVAENWLQRHVEKNKLRTGDEYRRVINRYILPKWKDRIFAELRRSDITALLDMVEDRHGARQADVVLTTLRSIASWLHKRDDSYTPPFARGMRRASREGRARILKDDEIRRLWFAADKIYPIGPLAQLLLLTAQRRQKLCALKWDDVQGAIWTIRTLPGEKGNAGTLKLPQLALDILQAQERVVDQPYVFGSRFGGPWDVSSTTKERIFEAEINRVAAEIVLKSSPQPDAARAEGHFKHALAVARQQKAKSWELRAAMSLAHLWRDQGKPQQARELLAPVYGWFTEGFDTLARGAQRLVWDFGKINSDTRFAVVRQSPACERPVKLLMQSN
jgi:integrase